MRREVYPVILAHTLEEYVQRLELVEQSSAEWVQIDVMDGQFVPNISVMPNEFMSIRTRLKLEAHLMTHRPERYFSDLTVANVSRVLIHVECAESPDDLRTIIKQATDYFNEVGVVINPFTAIEQWHIELPVECMQLMGVVPGQSGQHMLDGTFDRVREVRAMGWNGTIAIDGGVTEDNIALLMDAGANRFVVASHVFANNAVRQNLQHFIQLVTGGTL